MTLSEKVALYRQLEQANYAKAEKSLFHYFKCAWTTLEPSTSFLSNWHQGLISEYLTACRLRQISRLIINIPPRYTKSILVSVCLPTWVWITSPSDRFLAASYSQSLSTKHSVDRRRLLQSPWYQQAWADRFELMGDQNVKTEFENSKRGHMVATSIKGTATGKGGNWILIDDPMDTSQAESEAERTAANEAFDAKFTTRLDDKKSGVIIIIMQRLHSLDLTGHVLAKGENWEHLKIPAIEDEGRKVYSFPISGRSVVRTEGDVLHPEREDKDQIENQKRSMGSYAFAGQYQQRPAPRGGGILKEANWRFYTTLPLNPDEWLTSWDCSFKEKAASDFVAGTVWARYGVKKYLVDMVHRRMGFADTEKAIIATKLKYPKIRRVLVEDAANGTPIIETLKRKITGVTAVLAMRSKTERVATMEADHENGNYYLPDPVANPWVRVLIDECSAFPNSAHDDIVDSVSQAANWFLGKETKNFDALIKM